MERATTRFWRKTATFMSCASPALGRSLRVTPNESRMPSRVFCPVSNADDRFDGMSRSGCVVLLYADHVVGKAVELFQACCVSDLEGVVIKHRRGTYSHAPRSWLKV